MTTYDNTNSGVLFKNNKRRNDDDPLYRGTINVDGREFYLSAWINTSKAGDKYMSLRVKPKPEAVPERKTGGAGSRNEMNDDIGF